MVQAMSSSNPPAASCRSALRGVGEALLEMAITASASAVPDSGVKREFEYPGLST